MICGWDVSTAFIGVAFLDNNGAPIGFKSIDLRKKKTMVEKYGLATSEITSIVNAMSGHGMPNSVVHYVEDRLGGFTRGFTNQNTLLKLAQMNAVVTHHLMTMFSTVEVQHIAPVSAKRLVGLKVPKGGDKKAVAIAFARSVPGFPYELKKGGKTPKDGVADMADALIVALAGKKLQECKSNGS